MNSLLSTLLAAPILALALTPAAEAQCASPDFLDGGPCCTLAQPNIAVPRSFDQDALEICWKDCDVENVVECVAQWRLGNINTSPCAIRRMSLRLLEPATGLIKWRGAFSVQYSRTWQEISPTGEPIQVYRYMANGDLRATQNAGPDPCPVPPCAFQHNRRVKVTGYIDMAKYCSTAPGVPNRREFSWMLTHGCDLIDHQPGFPRAGVFHPDRVYSFVGPAAGFVPTPLQPVEAGSSGLEAIRRVDLSTGTPMCEYEEQVDFGIQPIQQFCICGPQAAQTQFVLSDFGLGGACGTTVISGGPYFPGFISMSVGSWTDPLTYPGLEGLRWNVGGYDYDDPCTGVTRAEAFFGVTTLRGYEAFSIPSVAGQLPVALPLTFIDQSNALRSGNTVLNVPWRQSDHFLNLNLP